MQELPPHVLLAEIDEIIRSMPSLSTLSSQSPDHLAWLGRASGAINLWSPMKATLSFEAHVREVTTSQYPLHVRSHSNAILTMLHQARSELRLRTAGPTSVAIGAGAVFDYFDEVRKIIEEAKTDLYVIDPYLEAEFVSRFLPAVTAGTSVRLLGSARMPSLVSAVQLFASQSGLNIEVRSSSGLHDRYILVDGAECYQSGSSFKDGAKKTPTALTQIADAFAAVHLTYENLWSAGTVHI